MTSSDRHVFTPDIEGKCIYIDADIKRCNGTLEDHLTEEQKTAMARRFDEAMSRPIGSKPPVRMTDQDRDRIGGPNGPKVCECGNALFMLGLVNGLVVLTCSACNEDAEIPWGVLRGHLKEPEPEKEPDPGMVRHVDRWCGKFYTIPPGAIHPSSRCYS